MFWYIYFLAVELVIKWYKYNVLMHASSRLIFVLLILMYLINNCSE